MSNQCLVYSSLIPCKTDLIPEQKGLLALLTSELEPGKWREKPALTEKHGFLSIDRVVLIMMGLCSGLIAVYNKLDRVTTSSSSYDGLLTE